MAVLPTDERRVAYGTLISNNGGKMDSASLVDGVDVGFTQQFDAKKAMYSANSRNNVESGNSVNSTNQSNYGETPDKHMFASGNLTGYVDWQWDDTSDPYNLSANQSIFVK
jgi:hypothetical protein